MSQSSPRSFVNQNLRDRSFRAQDLTGANFQGADLRGCDFRNAQLTDANFTNAKLGMSPKQRSIQIAIAIGVMLWIGDLTGRLIFGVLGQTPHDRAWPFAILLYGVLAIAGVMAVLRLAWAARGSVMLAGAMVGFFYAGTWTGNNAIAALIGMVMGGASFVILYGKLRGMAIFQRAAATIMTYGATMMLFATACLYLSAKQWLWGGGFGLLSMLYLGFTIVAFTRLIAAMRSAIGTSFHGANLTNACFEGVDRP